MLLDTQEYQPDDNLGYVIGVFCGVIPIVGIGVMVYHLSKGNRRKALQAIVLPVVLAAYLGSLLLIGRNWSRELDWLAQMLWFGGAIGVPLLTLWLLRRVPSAPRSVT